MKIQPGCTYKTKNIYYNAETGELLRTEEATNKEKYIIIKTEKQTIYNELKTRGTIFLTRRCLKQPQTKLTFN